MESSHQRITSQQTRVRRLAYVARSLLQKRYWSDGEERTIYTARSPRHFRRAFVEASLKSPFEVVRMKGGGCRFIVADEVIAKVDRYGQLKWRDKSISPISLAPAHIRALANRGVTFFQRTLIDRYAKACGKKSVKFADTTGYYDQKSKQNADLTVNGLAGGYIQSRKRLMAALATRAVKQFCAELDQERLRALRRASMIGSSYHHVAEAVTNRETGIRWMQALDAYPTLIRWVLVGFWDDIDFTEHEEFVASVANADKQEKPIDILRRTIEKGEPLVPVLASLTGMSVAQARRFRGVTPQRTGRMPSFNHIKFITQLPPHLRPVSRTDYRAACNLYGAIALMGVDVTTLTRGMKIPLGQERRIEALNGLKDVFSSMCGVFGNDTTKTLIGQLSLGRLVDLNVAWHRAHREATNLAVTTVQGMPEDHWPGFVPGGRLEVEGLTAVELTSPGELLREGRILQHCVGAYYPCCFSGYSRIVSLRDPDGRPRSTIEFQLRGRTKRSKPQPTIVQHYGSRNSRPGEQDVKAAKALLKILRTSDQQPWPRLPCPESVEDRVDKIIKQHMTGFFCQWFPPLAGQPHSTEASLAA